MNERVKELRKALHLSQSQFGEVVGVSNTAISKIEQHENKLTEQMIKIICSQFKVNHEWLVYGTGEMFREFPTTLLDQLSEEFDLDELEKQLIKSFISLEKDQRQTITQFLQNAINQ